MANTQPRRASWAVEPLHQSRIEIWAYELVLQRTATGGSLRLVGRDGAQPIEVEGTPGGPVLRLRSGLAISVVGDVGLTADRLALHARGSLGLTSDGAVDIRSGGDVAVQANDDVKLNGERIKLNCCGATFAAGHRNLAPMSTALQLSGRDASGRPILAVLVKRTYLFGSKGEWAVDTTQMPLRAETRYGDRGLVLEEDSELWPFKPKTDVVVLGHAYNHRGRPRFSAGIANGGVAKRIAVCGDRRCMLANDGRILFSPPAVAERVPLSYALAYGGRDAAAEAAYGNPVTLLEPYLSSDTGAGVIDDASPFVYPRNPAGRGYLVEAARGAVDALALPNLEHPDDLLTPERLAAGEPGRWPLQPVPASLGWLDYGAFPRAAWLGAPACHERGLEPARE